MKSLIKSIALTAIVAFGTLGLNVAPASAVTVNISTYQTGDNLGSSVLATLQANQVGSDVRFVLTNTATGQPASFLSQLLLTYGGSISTAALSNVSGKPADSFAKAASINNAGLQFQFNIGWPTTNNNNGALRLKVGQSSTFTINNTQLTGFFQNNAQSNKFAMIHLQGLTRGGSTKYTNGPPSVPLPAGLPLLLAGIGSLAALRRKRKSA